MIGERTAYGSAKRHSYVCFFCENRKNKKNIMHRRLKMNLAEHARRANTFTISAADPGHGSKKIYVLGFANLLSTVIA